MNPEFIDQYFIHRAAGLTHNQALKMAKHYLEELKNENKH